MGGKIKSKQIISGNMADILSNIYLGYSLIWYHHHNISFRNEELKNYCINYLNREIEQKINLIINNYPVGLLQPFLIPLKNTVYHPCLEDINNLYNLINRDAYVYNIMKDEEFPYLQRFEPVAKAIGIRPGEVCEILRPSKTAVVAPYYRICVQK